MSEKAKQWDRAAAEFQRTFRLGVNPYIQACLSFWEEKGMIFPGCRVLDVGCGVGKYGTLLAARGCDVTLTDISEEMLSYAEQNMAPFSTPYRLFACDFDEADVNEAAFFPRFDFCFSTMSPAIHDPATLQKLSTLSRGWCFVAGFVSSDAVLRRQVREAAGLTEAAPKKTPLREGHTTMEELKEMVSGLGFSPEMITVPYDWADRRTVKEQAALMRERYWKDLPEAADYDRKTLAFLESLADADGTVSDEVRTEVAWLYWRVWP